MARATIRVDIEGRGSIGPGKIRLLELIAETGSIAAAARTFGMSYRQAWLLTQQVAETLGGPAIATQSGGARGGHAELTAPAKATISAYRKLEAKTLNVCAAELDILDSLAHGQRPSGTSRSKLKRHR